MLQLFPPLFWAGVYEFEDEDRNVPAPYRCKPFDGLRAISIGNHYSAGKRGDMANA